MSDWWLYIMILLALVLYFNFEERRQERIERVAMRTLELVEQGHFTKEEAEKLHEALQ